MTFSLPAQERGWLSCPLCGKRLALIEGQDRERNWPCAECLAADGNLRRYWTQQWSGATRKPR